VISWFSYLKDSVNSRKLKAQVINLITILDKDKNRLDFYGRTSWKTKGYVWGLLLGRRERSQEAK
jgi:hypothetical protein